jgi:hypothetical protein
MKIDLILLLCFSHPKAQQKLASQIRDRQNREYRWIFPGIPLPTPALFDPDSILIWRIRRFRNGYSMQPCLSLLLKPCPINSVERDHRIRLWNKIICENTSPALALAVISNPDSRSLSNGNGDMEG